MSTAHSPSLPAQRDRSTGDVALDDDGASAALARLALTREELREAMTPTPRAATGAAASPPEGLAGVAADVGERVKSLPGVDLLLSVLDTWWARHPLRTVGLVAAEASRSFAAPIAQRRPLALVLGAMGVGALLMLLKPWRWMLRVLFAGLLPAVAFRLLRELPIDSWLKMYQSISVPRGAAPPTGPLRASPTMDVPPTSAMPPVASPASAQREPSTLYP